MDCRCGNPCEQFKTLADLKDAVQEMEDDNRWEFEDRDSCKLWDKVSRMLNRCNNV